MPLTLQDTSALTTTSRIPNLGFGVYQLYGQACQQAILAALSSGYRHIDSAQLYRNESDVGAAIKASPVVQREDVFLTTKIRQSAGSPEKTYQSCLDSIEKVGGPGGYVDLFLVHIPGTGRESREELWTTLERLHAEGRVRAIGVSNYRVDHLEEMKEYATVWPPHVNQIEVCIPVDTVQTVHRARCDANAAKQLHPWCQQRDTVQYCHDNNIVVAAYSPLSCGDHLNDPTLAAIAGRHGKSPAQVLIRFALQKKWVPLPKSGSPERIKQNADVFDFALDDEDMKLLDGLDRGQKGALFPANVK